MYVCDLDVTIESASLYKWTFDRRLSALICLRLYSVSPGAWPSSYMHRCRTTCASSSCAGIGKLLQLGLNIRLLCLSVFLHTITDTDVRQQLKTFLAYYVLNCSVRAWWWPERLYARLNSIQHTLLRWFASMQHQPWHYVCHASAMTLLAESILLWRLTQVLLWLTSKRKLE